jgi:Class III cytochrome C family.
MPYCHGAAAAGPRAGFPAAEQCMRCHREVGKDSPAVRRLAALPAETPVVPEKPLYQLPDFVIFSHARHGAGKISCDTCHGNVWAQDSLKLELNMKMKPCIDCHKKYRATVNCTACHELNQ